MNTRPLNDHIVALRLDGGRNVVIDNKSDFQVVTKEGVTATKEIELENPMENLDVQRKS